MNPRNFLRQQKLLAVYLFISSLIIRYCFVYKMQDAIVIPKMIPLSKQEECQNFTKAVHSVEYLHNYMVVSRRGKLEGRTSGMTINITAEGKAVGGSPVFEDAFMAPLLQWYRRAATWTTPRTPTVRFRSGGDVPLAFVLVTGIQTANGWYTRHVQDIVDGRCPLQCKVTRDLSKVKTADAVLIHMRGLKTPEHVLKKLGPRDPSQPWVMLEVETELMANSIHQTNYSTLDNFFNRTMFYTRDADIRIHHGFIVRRGLDASLLPSIWRRPCIVKQDNFNSRQLAVSFISHCDDNAGRLKYVRELEKHVWVDVYGKCGDWKCNRRINVDRFFSIDDLCVRKAGENYLFFLAFENALCEDYVTEKLYIFLFYPIVPVVMGAADYSTIMPPHSYIDAQQYTPQQLALKLTHLAKHPQEYAKYLEWRKYYQPSTIGPYRVFCDLCVRLHQPDFYEHHVIENFREWFVVKANCNRNNTVLPSLRH